jgi:hypothetical protein
MVIGLLGLIGNTIILGYMRNQLRQGECLLALYPLHNGIFLTRSQITFFPFRGEQQ